MQRKARQPDASPAKSRLVGAKSAGVDVDVALMRNAIMNSRNVTQHVLVPPGVEAN